MPKATISKFLLISTTCLFTPAGAQIVYKCGESYSSQTCPGGVIVNTADGRTKDQREQADRSTARDMRSANALESARLQQEAKDLAANTPPRQAKIKEPIKDKKASQRDKKIKPTRTRTPAAKKTNVPVKQTTGKRTTKL
jgi:hypothetical protein